MCGAQVPKMSHLMSGWLFLSLPPGVRNQGNWKRMMWSLPDIKGDPWEDPRDGNTQEVYNLTR